MNFLRFNLVFHTPSNYWAWRGLRWGKDDLCERERARWVGINAQAFPVQGPRFYSYSSGFSSALDKANPDLWHLHSLWIYPGVAMERWSRLACKPYMVTPNGMLEPWALSNSGWKKNWRDFFYENATRKHSTTIERQGGREKEQPKVGPKGEGLGTTESNDTNAHGLYRSVGRCLGKPSWRCVFKSLHNRACTGF